MGNVIFKSNNTPKMIKEHLDEDWNWRYLSFNPNITIEFINDNPYKNGIGSIYLHTKISLWK